MFLTLLLHILCTWVLNGEMFISLYRTILCVGPFECVQFDNERDVDERRRLVERHSLSSCDAARLSIRACLSAQILPRTG